MPSLGSRSILDDCKVYWNSMQFFIHKSGPWYWLYNQLFEGLFVTILQHSFHHHSECSFGHQTTHSICHKPSFFCVSIYFSQDLKHLYLKHSVHYFCFCDCFDLCFIFVSQIYLRQREIRHFRMVKCRPYSILNNWQDGMHLSQMNAGSLLYSIFQILAVAKFFNPFITNE